VLFFGVLVSFSRGAFSALVVGLIVAGWTIYRRRGEKMRLYVFVISMFILFAGMFYTAHRDLYQTRVTGISPTEHHVLSERLGQLTEATALIATRPLFGVGAGNYTVALMHDDDFRRSTWAYQPVHNSTILVLAELGIVGVGLIGMVVVLFFKTIITQKKQKTQTTKSTETAFLLIALAVFVITALFDHWQWDSHVGLFSGALLVGLLYKSVLSRQTSPTT